MAPRSKCAAKSRWSKAATSTFGRKGIAAPIVAASLPALSVTVPFTYPLRNKSRSRASSGVLFQYGALFSSLSVADNVMAPMRLMRVLGGMGFVLGAVALFLSKSKASIAIAGVMLMALIWLSRRAGATSRRTAVVAAAVCALVAAAMLAGGYGARLDDRLRATGGARIEYWRAAATIIGKKPVRGWGTGGFTRLYPLYRRKGAEDARLAHNVVLNLWTDYGLLGLLGGAMALAMPLGVAWARQLRQRSALPSAPVAAQGAHPAFSWLHAAGLVAATGFVLHCLVDFDFNIMGITVPALLALAIASARQNPTTPHAR